MNKPLYFLELDEREIKYLKRIMDEYNKKGDLYLIRSFSRTFKHKLSLLEKKV